MSINQPNEEKKLLLRIREGDEKAFAEFFYLSSPGLLQTIVRLVKTEEIARDLLQDVYIKAWLHRREFDGIEHPIAWLKKLAINSSFNHLRRARIEANWLQEAIAVDGNTKHQIEGGLLARELQTLIHSAVEALPQQRKAVYKLSREQGLERKEIAAELNLSENTVRNHLALSIHSIREFLQKKGALLLILFFRFYF